MSFPADKNSYLSGKVNETNNNGINRRIFFFFLSFSVKSEVKVNIEVITVYFLLPRDAIEVLFSFESKYNLLFDRSLHNKYIAEDKQVVTQ